MAMPTRTNAIRAEPRARARSRCKGAALRASTDRARSVATQNVRSYVSTTSAALRATTAASRARVRDDRTWSDSSAATPRTTATGKANSPPWI